jgi:hypothetical protein
LRGKHWTDQWARPCNRREVMAVEHVSIGRDVIETVVVTGGGRWPSTINAERPIGDEQSIEAIGYEINANRSDHQPGGIDRFTSVERNNSE